MKNKKCYLKWATVFIVGLLLATTSTINVTGDDPPSNMTRDEYFDYLETLPYFLEGTILNGSCITVITENGSPPPDMTPNDYDYCISFSQMENISEEARQEFIIEHGIDPYPPEPDANETEAYLEYLSTGANMSYQWPGPHEIGGKIWLKVLFARDKENKPFNPSKLYRWTRVAYKLYEVFYDVTAITTAVVGVWDASDVDRSHIENFYWDLKEDCKDELDQDNQHLMGWVRKSNQGSGWASGFYAVGKEKSSFNHRGIAQHEIAHCFGAPDHGWNPFNFCIMSYYWLFFHHFAWCSSCSDTIDYRIWDWQ